MVTLHPSNRAWFGRVGAFLLPLMLLGIATLQGVQAHEGASSELFADAEIVLAPFSSSTSVVVDGRIGSGEYGSLGMWTEPASGFTMGLLHDNDSLFVALKNPTTGWMAIGFSTDLDTGMGFVLVGQANGTFTAVIRVALNVSDELTFSPSYASASATLEAFNVTQQGGGVTAEFKVGMNSTIWAFEPGEIVPTIVAFSGTTASLPANATSTEVHMLRTYPLRPQDDPADIQKLFMADISPIPGLVGVGVMGVGVAAILGTFVRRKGSK